MSVDHYKCEVKDCDVIGTDDCWEISVDTWKEDDFWMPIYWVICHECAREYNDEDEYYDEDEDMYFLKKELFKIVRKKIILLKK